MNLKWGLKILFSFFAILFAVIAIANIFTRPVKAQTFIDCTATTNPINISPGRQFQLTITWSDNRGHQFVTDISTERFSADTSPYTVPITAPDNHYFNGINVASPPRIGPIFQCTANTTSTLPPPTSYCTYTFIPTNLKGGETITVTVKNTIANFSYLAYIGDIQSDPVTSPADDATVTLVLHSPDTKGTYDVGIRATGPRGSQACTQEGNHISLTVTEDNSGTSGRNPCDIPDPNNPNNPKCHTAFGDISTNITEFAGTFLSIAIGIAGGLALILLVFGSIRVLTSSGNQQTLAAGRDTIIAAIAGLLFLIFSVLILRAIGIIVGVTFP